jgi:sortase A
MLKKMNKKKIKYQVATGVVLIIVGIALLLINFVSDKRDEVFSAMNLALSTDTNEDDNVEEQSTEISDTENEEDDNEDTYVYEPYLGELEIPKINFYKGFYSKESSLNNVKFNLYVMPTSSYPDVENGNLIIAGHSGNYSNSYFRDLYQVEEGNQIYIYYNNVKYIYQVTKIYLQDKTGTINIYRDLSKTTLTLITCTQNDESHQTVYIAELIGKE